MNKILFKQDLLRFVIRIKLALKAKNFQNTEI